MLDASRSQLQLVWDAFYAALAQAVAADADTKAPLPAVPVRVTGAVFSLPVAPP